MRKPNLFIIGAAKYGTTALHAYLAEHPQICMSTQKEPGYWCTDIPGFCKVGSYEEYLSLFEAGDEHVILGEASPFYIYSEPALRGIREYNPDAKLIVMFRNPVEQAPAYHNQARYDGTDTVDDFLAAWRLQETRAAGNEIPRTCKMPTLLQYKAVASFGAQLERLYEIWPAEQVLVILMDDFKHDTAGVHKQVLEFLGLEDDRRSEFPRINESHQHRWPTIGRWLHNPPPLLLAVNAQLKKLVGGRRIPWRHLVAETRPRGELPREVVEELASAFEEDVAKLGRILGRDLSHWVS
jgi:hypothetical protein